MKKGRFPQFSLPIIIGIIFHFSFSPAQTHGIDSVRHSIQQAKDDTNKVLSLNLITTRFWRAGVADSALLYGPRAVELAKKLGFVEGLGRAYNNIGVVYTVQGNYPKALHYDSLALMVYKDAKQKKGEARVLDNIGTVYDEEGNYTSSLEYYFNSLAIEQDLKDKERIANTTANIGGVYDEQGDYPKALQYMLEGLLGAQEVNDKEAIANDLGNVGNVYMDEVNYPKALEYYFKALDMNMQMKDRYSISRNYGNIGTVYGAQHNYTEALKNDLKALSIKQEIGDMNGVAINLGNIGNIYSDMNNSAASLDFYYKALNVYKGLGDKDGVARNYSNIGNEYLRSGKPADSKKYLDSGLALAKTVGDLEIIKNLYHYLADLGNYSKDYKEAYANFQQYKTYYDSLVNSTNTKKNVQAEMNFEFQQKHDAEKTEQEKKDFIALQEHNKQVIIRDFFIVGFVLMLALAFLIFRGYNQKKKANEIITHQKELVEEKQKEILDSIHYAQRIQKALLASDGLLKDNLHDYFVLYKPKDIVSGDFYWATQKDGRFYLAVCDSTGHGVPGAFMSLLNISFLNEAINEKNIMEPDKVLNHARKRLIENISQDGQQDGMDGVIASLYPSEGGTSLVYSAAYNAPVIIRKDQLIELDADKIPVGSSPKEHEPFTQHSFKLEKGDLVYTFTDGYADQFGGDKGKKLKYKQLLNLLLSISKNTMQEQKQLIDKTFEEWKGNLEQVDDVLIIGIRI